MQAFYRHIIPEVSYAQKETVYRITIPPTTRIKKCNQFSQFRSYKVTPREKTNEAGYVSTMSPGFKRGSK